MAQKLVPLVRRLKTKFLDNSSSSIIPPPRSSSSIKAAVLNPPPAAAAAAEGGRGDGEVEAIFERWMMEHNKSYGSIAEKEKRFEIFKETVARIDEGVGGLNKFSDWTLDEFADMADGCLSD